MIDLIIFLLSAMFFVTLVVAKVPLMFWYRKFRQKLWHRRLMWKIERNLAKNSI